MEVFIETLTKKIHFKLIFLYERTNANITNKERLGENRHSRSNHLSTQRIMQISLFKNLISLRPIEKKFNDSFLTELALTLLIWKHNPESCNSEDQTDRLIFSKYLLNYYHFLLFKILIVIYLRVCY